MATLSQTVLFSICASSLLLVLILCLIVLTACKYKIYGFTFYLLIGLATVTAMTVAQGYLLHNYFKDGQVASEA